jgi:DNA-binding transcriptional MerR regulator
VEARTYNLKELGRVAGVTERTIRYYIKEGLLPPPSGSGPFSRYTYEHWLRLQFIKRLKDEYLPLSEIKNLLDERSLPDLRELAHQAGLIGPNGAVGPGYGESQPGPLLSLFRREAGPGTVRPDLQLREQMASFSPSAPASELRAFAPAPAPAQPEQAAEWEAEPSAPQLMAYYADPPEAESLELPESDFNISESRPVEGSKAPQYDRPGPTGAGFQAQAFRARATPPPGPVSGGTGLNPDSPRRAMNFSRAYAPQPASWPDSGYEMEAEPPGQAVPPQAPVTALPLMAKAAATPVRVSPTPSPAPASQQAVAPVSSQTWERVEVAPGVELHLEKSIAEANRPALAALLEAARRLFGPKES